MTRDSPRSVSATSILPHGVGPIRRRRVRYGTLSLLDSLSLTETEPLKVDCLYLPHILAHTSSVLPSPLVTSMLNRRRVPVPCLHVPAPDPFQPPLSASGRSFRRTRRTSGNEGTRQERRVYLGFILGFAPRDDKVGRTFKSVNLTLGLKEDTRRSGTYRPRRMNVGTVGVGVGKTVGQD